MPPTAEPNERPAGPLAGLDLRVPIGRGLSLSAAGWGQGTALTLACGPFARVPAPAATEPAPQSPGVLARVCAAIPRLGRTGSLLLQAMLLLLLLVSMLAAQVGDSPATAPPVAPPGNRLPPPVVPRTPGELLHENGGSLLRASLASPPATAGNRALEATSFFAVPEPEPRVIRKHDLVTIIIREQSEFMSDGSTETTKDAALEAEIAQMVRLNLANLALENAVTGTTPKLDLSGQRSFAGEGSVERTDRFTTRLTAEVVDVKPNGNLVLAARKRITTDDEEQVFLLAGIARAQDLTADNTILSTQLFDLDVRRLSAGAVRNATRRGMLPKLLDQLDLW